MIKRPMASRSTGLFAAGRYTSAEEGGGVACVGVPTALLAGSNAGKGMQYVSNN